MFRNFNILFMFSAFSSALVAELIFSILTAIKVVQMIRSRDFSQNAQFQLEKERFVRLKLMNETRSSSCQHDFRFWIYLELQAILIITYPVEILSFANRDESFYVFIIADIVKCFSALLIFTVVVVKNDIKTLLLLQYSKV